jgi:peptidoglycan biosynthesis protein MviN/MurJ (putative lipid II flippase)
LLVLLAKLVGAAKEMAVAWRYGVSEQIDAYLFVFNLVTWPVSVWFAVLPVVLIPLIASLRARSEQELIQFRKELFGLTLLLGGVLGLLACGGLRWLMQSPWSGLPATTSALAISMASFMAILTPLGFLISLFSAWMLASGRYANTLFESFPALAIFLALLLIQSGGTEPLVGGTLAGFALQLAFVILALKATKQFELPSFTLRSPHWQAFRRAIGVMIVGQALMSLTTVLDQFFAAHLQVGAVSSLSYANRILALIIGLGVTAVSRATLPVFAGAQVKDPIELMRLAARWTRILFGVGLVAIALGWALAPLAVQLLFERGAFGSSDTTAVASALRHGLLQLPPYFASIVLLSLLSARGQYLGLALAAVACLVLKIIGNLVLVPVAGLIGIQWSTGLMYLLYFIALSVLASRTSPRSTKAAPLSGTLP